VPSPAVPEAPPPNFRFWIQEAKRLLKPETSETGNYSDALSDTLYCARKALAEATSDLEWAEATNVRGVCQLRLDRLADALASFSEIATRFEGAADPDRCYWLARAAFNNGQTLGKLGRSEDELAAYDDVIARYGAGGELGLREIVARALVSKGVTLGQLGRGEEALSVYNDVIARYGAGGELGLREVVARALFSKGLTLGVLGRDQESLSVYNDVIARFGAEEDPTLKAIVEMAKNLRST
jgi:tetratricopeptide (TPR) repeat protein